MDIWKIKKDIDIFKYQHVAHFFNKALEFFYQTDPSTIRNSLIKKLHHFIKKWERQQANMSYVWISLSFLVFPRSTHSKKSKYFYYFWKIFRSERHIIKKMSRFWSMLSFPILLRSKMIMLHACADTNYQLERLFNHAALACRRTAGLLVGWT